MSDGPPTDAPADAPTGDPALVRLVETWHRACEDFVALARELREDEWHLPTDLAGWDVHANVAHTAHLEAVLAGTPEETIEVAAAPHLVGQMNFYTEQGVLARRSVEVPALAEEIEQAVATRYADLRAEPPTDDAAAPARTPGGIGWSTGTLLSNRPLDVWMHEQDIRRATGRPGGYDSPAAHHVVGVFARALPMVLGKRVAPPAGTTVRLHVGDRELTATVGDDGRATRAPEGATADVTITLTPEEYVVLSGGRRGPDSLQGLDTRIQGDQELGRRLLAALPVTP